MKETVLAHLPHVDIFENLRKEKESIIEVLNETTSNKNETSKKIVIKDFPFKKHSEIFILQ